MLSLKSSSFNEDTEIPVEYSCRGQNTNPPLEISNVPKNAKSLALLVDDPDAHIGDWVHWLIWNIDPKTTEIRASRAPEGSIEGRVSSGNNKYEGPCPPSGTHHYKFKLYALSSKLNLVPATDKQEFLKAISGHVLEQTTLTGIFSH